MTLLQLRIAVATAELKSITAAADLLHISQPNASTSMKRLKDEIGFPVFAHTGSDDFLTPKGEAFLKLARQILEGNDKILSLRDAEDIYRLRLGTTNYYAAAEPFFKICAEHRDDRQADFRYLSVSVSEGITALVKSDLDIIAAPVMKYQTAGLTSACEENEIEMISICSIPVIMMMRKDHPAASDSRCLKITQGCETMKDYPYVALRNFNSETGATALNDADFAQCSYKIYVDDTNARLRMIEATNGFGFGLPSSYRMMSQFGLIFFPVPDVSAELFCLVRSADSNRREIQEYISLLQKEMRQLLNSI